MCRESFYGVFIMEKNSFFHLRHLVQHLRQVRVGVRCARICAKRVAQIFFMKREFACDFICAAANICATANTFMKPGPGLIIIATFSLA